MLGRSAAGTPSEAVWRPDCAVVTHPPSQHTHTSPPTHPPHRPQTAAYLHREAFPGVWRCRRDSASWSWASSRLIIASNSRDSASVAPSLRPLRPSSLRRERRTNHRDAQNPLFRCGGGEGEEEKNEKRKKKLAAPIPRFPPPCDEKTL